MSHNKFIFCLEAVPDVDMESASEVVLNLERLAMEQHIDSIYKTCDTIEGMQDSLDVLLHHDHNFRNYEVIYLIMQGAGNTVCLNDYYYSFQEIAELFEGKMTGKIIHFANAMTLDLTLEEAQYFLNITGARAISGYETEYASVTSSALDKAFFTICQDQEDVVAIVDKLHAKYYDLCTILGFKLYY